MSFRRPCGRFFIAYTNVSCSAKLDSFFVSAIKVTDLSPLEGFIFVYIIYLNVHKIKPERILFFLSIGIIIIDRRKGIF